MEIIALVGPSGTGKSHRALAVAHDIQAEAIIDDGLLIQDTRILAGVSAKAMATRIKATKTAIFDQEDHVQEVRLCLAELALHKLLILGTSDKMIERIVERLGLPKVSRIIRIEEISTEEQRKKAQMNRFKQGKHIIPVPTMEVKPRLSGTWLAPLKTKWMGKEKQSPVTMEATIVRPAFTYLGKFQIAEKAVETMAAHVVEGYPGVKADRVRFSKEGNRNTLSAELALAYHRMNPQLLREIQKELKERLEEMTAVHFHAVNLEITRLMLMGESPIL